MTIATTGWTIQNDRMPGSGGSFRVRGTVTVAHPGITPVLVKPDLQDKSFALNLNLELVQEEGIFPQVLTDKAVYFEMPGNHSNIPFVRVFHEGKLLTTVDKIITTN